MSDLHIQQRQPHIRYKPFLMVQDYTLGFGLEFGKVDLFLVSLDTQVVPLRMFGLKSAIQELLKFLAFQCKKLHSIMHASEHVCSVEMVCRVSFQPSDAVEIILLENAVVWGGGRPHPFIKIFDQLGIVDGNLRLAKAVTHFLQERIVSVFRFQYFNKATRVTLNGMEKQGVGGKRRLLP